jgi:MarR family transcriptional regulator, organic hydroperoxide resistance regulator|tara:strand:+ start:659 stop:1165 length:507 start_codon:yes stop_codon:yes gene_type:complete
LELIEMGVALENRTKVALTAMRKILRTTELNSKRLMQETGLTPSQLIFMQLLDDEREQTAGYVAGRMGITQATTTALLQKLEALGMIQRRKGETDRRQVWLSLTDAGRKVLTIAPDGVHARFQEQFAALDDWEQAMLIASLERVAALLGNEDQAAAAVLDATAALSSD